MSDALAHPPVPIWLPLTRTAGVAAGIIGSFVLAGWLFDLEILKRISPGLVSMKANTALCMALCGASLALLCGENHLKSIRYTVAAISILAAVVGVESLCETLFGWDLRIDQFLFRDDGALAGTVRPGLMAPAIAFCFALTGGALATRALSTSKNCVPLLMALGGAVAILGGLSLTGYVSEAAFGYRWGSYTGIAVHTAMGLVCLGGGLVTLARSEQQWPWSLGKLGTAGFLAGIALMLAVQAIAFNSTKEMETSAGWVSHTLSVLKGIRDIKVDLANLEGRQRGYLITGDERVLEPRDEDAKALEDHLKIVRNLTADNPDQQASLDQVQNSANRRATFEDQTIAAAHAQGLPAGRQLVASGTGITLSAGLDRLLKQMSERESDLLDRRQIHSHSVSTMTFMLLPLGVLLSLTTMGAGLSFLNSSIGDKRRTERALRSQLEAVFEAVYDGIAVFDMAGNIVLTNESQARIIGFASADEMKRNISYFKENYDLTHRDGAPVPFDQWPPAKVLRGELVVNWELKVRRKDIGREWFFSYSGQPVYNEQGEQVLAVITTHDITGRKEADQALRKSETQLHAIVENISEAVIVSDLNGLLLHFNHAALDMLGFATLDQGRRNFRELADIFELSGVDGAELPVDQWPLARILRGEKLHDFEARMRRIGTDWERVYSFGGTIAQDAGGTPLMAIVTFSDITERKRTESAALLLAAIVESSADAVIGKDSSGIVTSWNAAAERIFGYSAEEMMGHSIMRIVPPDLHGEEEQILSKMRRGEQVEHFETQRLRKDGGLVSISVTASPIRDSHGTVIGSSKVARDITGRKRVEKELRESEERFRMLVEGVHEYAIILLDPEGKVASWNAGAERIKGYKAAEIIGKPFSVFYPPEDVAAGKPAMELKLVAQHGRWEDEGWRVRADGTRFWANVLITALKDDAGNLRGFSKLTRDITNRRRVQQELSKAKEDAEAANRAKSEFLANMSHEIRTPMNAIMGFADMILNKDQDKGGRIECAQIIRRNAQHLLELINEILDLSKIEASQMTVELISCDLPALLSEVISLMRPRVAEKGLEFEVIFDGPIPRLIQTDPLRLRQILVNLLGNAMKFTAAGKIKMRIADSEAGGPNIVLRVDVNDSGIGLPPEQLDRVFQPFTQGDESITRKFGGSGLGLAISGRLAKLLNGDIYVESKQGVGSTFTLKIDGGSSAGVEMLQDMTEAILPVQNGAAVHPNTAIQGSILLVEDGHDNQRLLGMQLGDAGAEVVIAENGKIGVDLATKRSFDLILMDMQMPVMDGYAATGELRRRGLKTPIIALTAFAMAGDRAKCLASGCDDYLSKPVKEELLLSTIRQHLGRSLRLSDPAPTRA